VLPEVFSAAQQRCAKTPISAWDAEGGSNHEAEAQAHQDDGRAALAEEEPSQGFRELCDTLGYADVVRRELRGGAGLAGCFTILS
jgi:hypothetical protein